jgi:nucleoside-diphosphate-sugar epimerase
VAAVDCFTRAYPRRVKEANLEHLRDTPGFELHEVNVLGSGFALAVRGADAICHLAGRPGARDGHRQLFELGNVRTTRAALRAAAAEDVPRVLLASSSSVYGTTVGPVSEDADLRPLSPYGESKRRAERLAARLAARFGLELVTLRYFTVYGPRQRPDMAFARFTRAALGGRRAELFGDGRQVRDFTYVEDAAEATRLAIERGRPGAVYNVAGGRPASLEQAIALIGDALHWRPRFVRAPADPREPRSTSADLARVRSELGWEPRVDLAAGILHQVRHAAVALAY